MRYLGGCEAGVAIRYEPGDRVIVFRGPAGERGTVLGQITSDDRRLARQLYIEIRLDGQDEPVCVVPSHVKPDDPAYHRWDLRRRDPQSG